MWWEFKDIVIYSYPYDFLQLTESLCRSLETSPKCVIFELGNSGSLRRVHKNSLPDKRGRNVVRI